MGISEGISEEGPSVCNTLEPGEGNTVGHTELSTVGSDDGRKVRVLVEGSADGGTLGKI